MNLINEPGGIHASGLSVLSLGTSDGIGRFDASTGSATTGSATTGPATTGPVTDTVRLVSLSNHKDGLFWKSIDE